MAKIVIIGLGHVGLSYLEKLVFDKSISGEVVLIDKDVELTRLNEETRKLFDFYYEFDSHRQSCWFNEELERKTKDRMLELIRKIKNRLSEINDGSLIVKDYETERLEKL